MTTTGRTVIGVFDEAGNADRAIDALQNAGFDSNQIYHSGRGAAATGGFFEGIRNFFTGDDSTESSGHVADDLTHMGVSNDEARYYENEYNNGRTIVAVSAGDRAEEIKSILDTNGAYNYANQRGTGSTSGTTTDAGYNAATTTAATTGTTDYDTTRNAGDMDTTNTTATTTGTGYTDTATTGTTGYDRTSDTDYANETDDQRALRLRAEQLNVNKQQVQAGEVTLGKQVVEEQKTVNVPVTHEEVYIENRPVSGNVTDDATPIGTDESIRVPVSEERVNVSKDTVTTGEVSIGKRAVQENQQVTDTVRHEEARLDQSGNPVIQGDTLNTDATATTNTDNTTDTRNSY
jgi:uncharacterized protein (TIGR02271 family)